MTAPPLKAATACLEEAVLTLYAQAVAVAVTDPKAEHAAPFAIEAQAVATAREGRRREFRAGRAAAHEAMRRMGLSPAPIPAGADRAPLWPGTLTGSISHSGTLCIAVLADARGVPALGIDIEEAQPLETDLIGDICTLPERAWLSSQPAQTRGLLARLLFSAKECAYKCQYTLSHSMLGFLDLEITADLVTGQFEATFLRAVPRFATGARLYGRYIITQDHIITAIATERHHAAAPQERRLSLW